MKSKPFVTQELLEYLESIYKDVHPTRSELKDERNVYFRAGQLDVVKALRSLYEEISGVPGE